MPGQKSMRAVTMTFVALLGCNAVVDAVRGYAYWKRYQFFGDPLGHVFPDLTPLQQSDDIINATGVLRLAVLLGALFAGNRWLRAGRGIAGPGLDAGPKWYKTVPGGQALGTLYLAYIVSVFAFIFFVHTPSGYDWPAWQRNAMTWVVYCVGRVVVAAAMAVLVLRITKVFEARMTGYAPAFPAAYDYPAAPAYGYPAAPVYQAAPVADAAPSATVVSVPAQRSDSSLPDPAAEAPHASDSSDPTEPPAPGHQ